MALLVQKRSTPQFTGRKRVKVTKSSNIARWARKVTIFGLTGLGAFTLACASLQAAPVDTKAKYIVSLGGVNIANTTINFSDNGSTYAVDVDADVAGVGALVASGSAMLGSHGTSKGKSLLANNFTFETRTKAERFNVGVQYAKGNATGFKIDPPLSNHLNRIALERKHLQGVSDPLGAFILKGGTLDASLCDRRLKVFTGVERYDIDMSFAAKQTATSNRTGYQGPVVLCKMRYIPVSGHFTSSEVTGYLANSDRILVWYAPLKDSEYFIPYRVLLGTAAGDLSMVLTGLQ